MKLLPKPTMSEADLDTLPPRLRVVLEALRQFIQANGYPPSIQQLCQVCGVSSTSTIHYHLTSLKKRGLIQGNPLEKRALSLHPDLVDQLGRLPVLGTIAAGSPLQTTTDTVDELNLASDLCPPGCYGLRVKGESMIEDHIMEGDMVIVNPKATVRDGDVVVALVEGETATLKRLYREKDRVRLQPANAAMEPIYISNVQDLEIQGKVEAVIRQHL